MLYAYCEDYILTLNDRDISSLDEFMESLPGEETGKWDQLKTALGYFMTHPGKKYLASYEKFPSEISGYLKGLNELYKEHPGLWEADGDPAGFQWLQTLEAEKCMLAYMRRDVKKKDVLLILCNFSGEAQEGYKVGVPYYGKYKEIFNSDAQVYGGAGVTNPRAKTCRKEEWDERPYSVSVKVPALGIAVFVYQPA